MNRQDGNWIRWGRDGGFGPEQALPMVAGAAYAELLTPADFDGDGWIDLASVADFPFPMPPELAVQLNDAGTLGPASTWNLPSLLPSGLASVDLDLDHRPDLVFSYGTPASQVAVYLAGHFDTPANYPAGDGQSLPSGLAVGDLNGDGRPDVCVGLLNANEVAVLAGGPGGTLGRPSVYATGSQPSAFALGDFNGDGWLDVATTNDGDKSLSVLLNARDGGLDAPATQSLGFLGLGPSSADLDGDGLADLALVDQVSGSLLIFRSRCGP